MTYRKTWFSSVLWLLYTILCIALLAISGEVWMHSFSGFSGNMLIIFGMIAIPAAAALYWIIRGIATWAGKKRIWKAHTIRILGSIAFLLIMAGGVLIRVICLKDQLSLAESGSMVNAGGMEFYDMAVVTEDNWTPFLDHGISDLYVMLLSTVLSFLGNRVVSAVYLQVFLQIIAMVLVYAVTRKIAGRLPACAALLYIAGSLSCRRMLVCFGPEWLFFIFYMFGMLMTVNFVKSYCENRLRKPLALIGAVAIGVLIGGLAYLDIMAFSLLVVIVAVAVGKRPRQMKMPVCNSVGINAAVILMTSFACAAVWFGVMGIVSYVKGTDPLSDVTDKLWLCYQNSYPFTNMEPYLLDIYLIGILIIPASFLVFEFFRKGHEQNYTLWILLCLLAAPTPMAVYGEHGFGVLSLYIWAVLAGLGLQNCLFGGRAKVIQAVIEEINADAERAEASEQSEEPVNAAQITEEEKPEEQDLGTETVIEVQQPEMAENQEQEPRYIENPLPLPKKHVARELDYQYVVEEKDMKYDVEVPDDDDFDVQ